MLLDNITACETWECVNSFASWLSAGGTILISSIAIWLSIRDRIIRVETSFDIAILPTSDPTLLDLSVYALQITNIGVRPVTVTGFKWVWRKGLRKKLYGITYPYADPETGRYCTELPSELTFGQQAHIFHKSDFFAHQRDFFDFNGLITWWRIKTFYLVIGTSVGREFKVKIHKRVREHVWDEYCRWREAHGSDSRG